MSSKKNYSPSMPASDLNGRFSSVSNKVIAVIVLLIAILLVGIGLVAGYLLFSTTAGSSLKLSAEEKTFFEQQQAEGGYKNTFADGWEAARQKLILDGAYITEVDSLSGNIIAINSDAIEIEVPLITPLDEKSLHRRLVKLTDDTLLYKRVPRDLEDTDDMAVDFYEEEAIELSDLTVGQRINVEAGSNIAFKLEFPATRIFYETDMMGGNVPTASSDGNIDDVDADIPPPPPPSNDSGETQGDVPPPPPPPPVEDENYSDGGDVSPPPIENEENNAVDDVPPPPPPPPSSLDETD